MFIDCNTPEDHTNDFTIVEVSGYVIVRIFKVESALYVKFFDTPLL